MTLALSGVRVLELTHIWSGPLAGRVLTDLGAEVIHISSRAVLDSTPVTSQEAEFLGTFPANNPGEKPWERHVLKNDLNRNKLGLTLELNTSSGVDVFKRLVKISDVVMENYSPRVMPNFGLDYPVLRKLHPGIIMCSMPGYGLSGPYRDYVAFGTNIEPACGLSELMGYPNEGPRLSGNPYPDPAAAMHAVAAILTALYHRNKTGDGQQIDLSQCESATCWMGEAVLDYAINNRAPKRMGNHHPSYAPFGCYPCKGNDKWVVIEIRSDAQWLAFIRIMGNPSWVKEKKFSDLSARLRHRFELDKLIAEWTTLYSHYEVMQKLQKEDVPAGAVLNAEEILSDPHLSQREFFLDIDHPGIGSYNYVGSAIRFKGDHHYPNRPAPSLGEHNGYVLRKILGLSEKEVTDLEKEGVIGTAPLNKPCER